MVLFLGAFFSHVELVISKLSAHFSGCLPNPVGTTIEFSPLHIAMTCRHPDITSTISVVTFPLVDGDGARTFF
ncbi:hypothetical protein F4604DRAFT_1790486 [Suillus subluteus]|nr:hypothetical protein F4604DRAFT_1790486 [Suillus subluteus]